MPWRMPLDIQNLQDKMPAAEASQQFQLILPSIIVLAMALSNSSSSLVRAQQINSVLCRVFIFLLISLPLVKSVSFSMPNFTPNTRDIVFEGDAYTSGGALQLTRNLKDDNLTGSVGRATYQQPVRLWNAKTRQVTDFTTHFSFIVKAADPLLSGDGLTFFIAPFSASLPCNSSGGYLGLFSPDTAMNTSRNHIVAVEFDSFQNPWDPSSNHVGIDVNSIVSLTDATLSSSFKTGEVANAWVIYNSTTMNLNVYLAYEQNPVSFGVPILSLAIDFTEVLPEWIRIGFSAATGQLAEMHKILTWDFSSSLQAY